jgi:hypothetical protein
VAIGNGAGNYAVEANNNDSNTAIGEHSLYQGTNESYDTCIGRASCYNMTTGVAVEKLFQGDFAEKLTR